MLCQREYYGLRCCPACRQRIYSTEMTDRDLLRNEVVVLAIGYAERKPYI
ncbi:MULTISPECIES: zinc-ribbon domain-containing protein [Enterobacteriaceae]|nr:MULTISPECIES: zinc-ribbon domain-containing protein [Enterobacteriaceae]WFZ24034.1 zinc-ribbon domain-containing protein [Citrobacter portucalensis]